MVCKKIKIDFIVFLLTSKTMLRRAKAKTAVTRTSGKTLPVIVSTSTFSITVAARGERILGIILQSIVL